MFIMIVISTNNNTNNNNNNKSIVWFLWGQTCFHSLYYSDYNVGLGLSIFSSEFSRFGNLTLLFIAYIIFDVILQIVLYSILKACSSVNKGKKDNFTVKLESNNKVKISESKEDKKERKEPSADSIYRWLGLWFFVAITVAVILALIVLVALPM